MRNVGLCDSQAGIKTAGRNINYFRYADDTTLMAEIKEELLDEGIPEGKIGLPRANPRGRLRSPS